MAQPKSPSELTALAATLDASADFVVEQGSVVGRVTPTRIITEAATFTQSGSGATSDTVQNELRRGRISPFQFMTEAEKSDVESLSPTLDMATVLSTAAVRAVAQGKYVDLGGYIWLLGSQLSIATNGVKFWLGGATIKKGFNGDLITVSGTDFALDGTGFVDGQHGTYTGKGILFTGSTSHRPYFSPGISLSSFTDTHLQFAADSGQSARIYCEFRPGSGQTDYRAVHCLGTDTIACFRKIIGSVAVGGYHDLDGAQNTTIQASSFKRVEIASTCSQTSVIGARWGNADAAMTISGGQTILIGNGFSGDVTLDANWSGQFVGNYFTAGALTNSSSALGVFHSSGSVITVGKTSYYANGTYRTLGDKVTACGDQDQTFSVGGNGPTMRYSSTLSADRTVTLSTTGAVNGDWCLVTRTGGNSGGPWTVSVGGLKSLVQNEWALVKYDGSAFFLAQYGTL